MNLRGNEPCYTWQSLIEFQVHLAFEEKLFDEESEIDKDFNWILVNNKVILPLGYSRITAGASGTGSGTSTGWFFEFEVLYEFQEDVMSIIKEKSLLVKDKPRKRKQLISNIWSLITEHDEDSLEILKEFK